MEETQIQLQNSMNQLMEPEASDNSQFGSDELADLAPNQVLDEGQSSQQDPSSELILGKFKSVDDLSKAYEELQRYQGHCSDELGSLRKEVSSLNSVKQMFEKYNTLQNGLVDVIKRDQEKYNSPEYFKDPTFREIYKEALMSFGTNLDTDRLINLLDSYANARIFANDKKKAAQKENQQVIDSMSYKEASKATFNPPKKRFDEMTEKEIDEMLDRLI